jgi:hypothetical protein
VVSSGECLTRGCDTRFADAPGAVVEAPLTLPVHGAAPTRTGAAPTESAGGWGVQAGLASIGLGDEAQLRAHEMSITWGCDIYAAV